MKETGIVCELGAKDVARSIAFYESLGFTCIETVPTDGIPAWAELSFHGSRLMLQETHELVADLPGLVEVSGRPSHVIVLRVGTIEDVEQLHNKFTASSVETGPINHTDYGTAEFAIADPDGYVILIAGS